MVETSRGLSALNEEFVEVTFRHEPVLATAVGIHDYDHLLPDDSPEGFAVRRSWLSDFTERVSREVNRSGSAEFGTDLALLQSRLSALSIELNEVESRRRDPVRGPENALDGVFLLMSRTFAPLVERKEAVLARLMATPAYLERLRPQLDRVPAPLVEAAIEVASAAPAFLDDVVRALRSSFPGEAERIEHAGDGARLAFLSYREFLEKDLAPRATALCGIGAAAFARRLREEHRLALGVESIEQLGRDVLASSLEALENEARRIDSTRDWREQISDAAVRHPEPEHLIEAYSAETERARDFVVERRIAPEEFDQLELIETPIHQRALVPWALYLPPAPFDERPTGVFFVTPVELSRPREEQELQLRGHAFARIPLIVVHEAYPGRHLQASCARHARSRLRQLASNDLLAEGWALYCAELMDGEDYFGDPLTRLFRLRDLALRACRVIVDVSIHSGRLDFAQAVDWIEDQVVIGRSEAVREVRRAVIQPTHQLSYLVGKHEIESIRGEAERRLGPDFRLHDFHRALLSAGALPPALVREDTFAALGVPIGSKGGA